MYKYYNKKKARQSLDDLVNRIDEGKWQPKTVLDYVPPLVRQTKKKDGRGGPAKYQFQSRLTEEQVRNIKNDTDSIRAIAAKYDVHYGTIAGIRSGKTWKHVT